jgi:hypothetical protein
MLSKSPKEMPLIARFRVEHFFVFDSFLLMFYTALVYGLGLTVHPMGRDYAAMASNGEGLPFLADRIFAWEVQTFGAWPLPYHLVNVVVLYGCVWCVMNLTNFTVRGIWWLGTWAAVIFMANPLHTESVLNLSGIGDLVPAFFALLAVTAYAFHAYAPRKPAYAFALLSFTFAVAAFPHHAFLFIIIVLFEVLITRPKNRHFPRIVPFVVIGIAAVAYHWPVLSNVPMDVRAWFTPLYFTFYPIGFLPENMAAMNHRPWLGWCAALAVAAVLFLIYRQARRPAILFALLSMMVIRLFPEGRSIDPVHLVGGGQLVVATGLFAVGFAALAFRCMDHPKWKVPIVGMTTACAIAFMLVQIRAEMNWRTAGSAVKTFQASAIAASDSENGAEIGILPDWRFYRGAPVMLSESIRFDTPFSKAVNQRSILSLNATSVAEDAATLNSWDTSGGSLQVHESRVVDAFVRRYEKGDRIDIEGSAGDMAVEAVDESGFTVAISAGRYPVITLPATLSFRKETGGDSESSAGDEEAGE